LAAASEAHEKRQRITPPSEVCEARYAALGSLGGVRQEETVGQLDSWMLRS